jgi:hypothetical protein
MNMLLEKPMIIAHSDGSDVKPMVLMVIFACVPVNDAQGAAKLLCFHTNNF